MNVLSNGRTLKHFLFCDHLLFSISIYSLLFLDIFLNYNQASKTCLGFLEYVRIIRGNMYTCLLHQMYFRIEALPCSFSCQYIECILNKNCAPELL